MNRAVANALGFQIVWFTTVAGVGHGLPWAGPLTAIVFAAWVLSDKTTRSADVWLLLRALPIGYMTDCVWVASGWIRFAEPWPAQPFAPIWILALWVGLILSINHSLVFLHQRPWLAMLLGAVSGPIAYYGASRGFSAAAFEIGFSTMMWILAITWAALLPLLLAMSAHYRRRLAISAARIATGECQ